ncbi:Lon protease family protein [Aliidiomarina minuta]|uniref:endopeptidase La n=1 Tax=Aliidiomarina minuta TaxID=880057 RepID=A0A432W6K2_9GAMM|nr:Lon protease family protein [Aliidiomarina minuta]RUO25700.1 Lon protease family protein [Aliidiomarina minuta]
MENSGQPLQLQVAQLRAPSQQWVTQAPSVTTPDPLIGQQRALAAIKRAQSIVGNYSHVYAIMPDGLEPQLIFEQVASSQNWPLHDLHDWVYLVNPEDSTKPLCLHLPTGTAKAAIERIWALLDTELVEREDILLSIRKQFNWPPLNRYLQQIKDKTFEDLPGNELATIIISQDRTKAWHYCARASETELFGQIRLQTIAGTVSSELHLIQSGALLKANGGTLVIDAEHLLRETALWHRLKHILKSGEFSWNQPGNEQTAVFYEPQPVPVKLKVILAGSRGLLSQLRELDADFANLFPYLADFTDHYPCQQQSVAPYFNYLTYLQQRTQHRPLSQDGYQELLTVASSFTEHQQELSLDSLRLIQLLEEADAIAHDDKSSELKAIHIDSAIKALDERELYLAELSQQSILEHQVKIDTEGELIGQINGLTVVTMGGSEFGEPSRITATVHYGDGDIIDIERKSELSGNIHTKGVMILMAYLANLFAGREPMPLSATLVFEQSYHEVDGDSASLAELCCLVSALSNTPIQQSIAITGAIDQFGNVQAIGGINEKIEGFFKLCKQRGLNGEHGVIVPQANLMNLHLSKDVCNAVESGLFSVVAVNHVSQAFELLMRTPCGKVSDHDPDTLFGRIYKRIRAAHQQEEPSRWWRKLWVK